jgi:RNA polymerase sigma-70 factor (ECF subfamily)
MQLTDKEIIEKYLKGDLEIFSVLIEKYKDGLYRYCYRFTNNARDAEDVSQQTFIKLFENIEKLDLEKPLKAWIFTVATNFCRSLHAKKKNLNFTDLEGDDEDSEEGSPDNYLADENIDIPKEVQTRELQSKVKNALDKIEKKYQIVLTLYYIDSFSYEEIANNLKIPINTVRTYLRRGKEKLTGIL